MEKIKAIYHTLNMFNFDMSHNSLIAEGWCPLKAHEELRRALKEGEVIMILKNGFFLYEIIVLHLNKLIQVVSF